MYSIDLNCDLGESFGAYTIGRDKEVIPLISSANVACGFHASDPVIMAKTVDVAAKNQVQVGAHPGFPDLMGFGRRQMKVTPDEAKAYVQYQVGALMAFCRAKGIEMQHVKPHGALYNMAGKDYELAKAICLGVKEINPELIMLVLAGSKMEEAAADLQMKFAREIFADRAYESDGSLVDRRKPGAMITDEKTAIERVVRMIREHRVTSIDGDEIEIIPDSVCVHGDGEKALLFISQLRKAFEENGISIVPLNKKL